MIYNFDGTFIFLWRKVSSIRRYSHNKIKMIRFENLKAQKILFKKSFNRTLYALWFDHYFVKRGMKDDQYQ